MKEDFKKDPAIELGGTTSNEDNRNVTTAYQESQGNDELNDWTVEDTNAQATFSILMDTYHHSHSQLRRGKRRIETHRAFVLGAIWTLGALGCKEKGVQAEAYFQRLTELLRWEQDRYNN